MKILHGALLVLLVQFPAQSYAFDPCHPDEGKYTPIAERYDNGLVFKIEKCGVEPSYILGTIHTDNAEVINKAAFAFDIMAASKSAHFETLFEGEDIKEQLEASYFPVQSPETLETYIDREYMYKFRSILTKDYPEFTEMVYYRMRPWAAAMILQYPKKTSTGMVLDEQLQAYAKIKKVPVYGIESGKEMMKYFEEMSQTESVDFFKYSVDNYELQVDDMKELTDAYIKEDIQEMNKLADESIKEMKHANIMDGFEDKLIYSRSKKMVDRTVDYINQGGAFIAVGTLHLPGDKGMLKLLEDKGYYIEVERDIDPDKEMLQ
jgi:hypothetical protein